LVEIVLFIIDSGCSKHMTGNLKLLINFAEKFLGTIKFGNDQIAPIGYGDLVQGAVTIKKSTRHRLKYGYGIVVSHLNFDTINLLSKNDIVVGLPKLKFVKDHLCSSCELGKSKQKSFHTKLTPSSKRRLQLLHMDLCGTMRVASINGKRYVLVIVEDYSRYTWTHFLRSKDETPEVLIDFLRLIQRGLQAQVRVVRTDKGTEFLNQTLHAYFAAEGILHQMSVARTPEQNGVVERQNRTLVEATRTLLSAAKVPLFFWAEAIATACFTQNRSLVIPRHEKTPYHIINDRKPSVKFFHIFGSVCYIVRVGENLDKMKEKGNECIFVGYSKQSRAYRVFNKRTRVIMESIHVNFDELPQMASDQLSYDPAPECQTMALEKCDECIFVGYSNQSKAYRVFNKRTRVIMESIHVNFDELPQMASVHISSDLVPECHTMALEPDSLSPGRKCQENVSHGEDSQNVISKSSAVTTADECIQRQHLTTLLNNHSTPAPSYHPLEQVIGNPSQSIRTRRQLESDAEMCMFALTVSRTEPKNIKEAMADSAWIESMQEELH
nr:retrovirus-related Pol polyprotein from transposon TNT 1-94 [Tanacetum cinerariifolium]